LGFILKLRLDFVTGWQQLNL